MRNKFLLTKNLISISLFICYLTPVAAQNSTEDSVYYQQSVPECSQGHTHTFKWEEIAIPTTLVGLSILSVENDWIRKHRLNIQDALSDEGECKVTIDDYMQYSPMAASYVLDFAGVKAKHSLIDRTIILAMSYTIMGAAVYPMKYAFKNKRPDSNARNSFPSGHTATAFMGAQFLYEEYKDVSPWIGYAGFTIAAATGYLRIYNHRHYLNDVIAGACVGILSTKLAYWLYPKIFKKSKCNNDVYITGAPYYSKEGMGINMAVTF